MSCQAPWHPWRGACLHCTPVIKRGYGTIITINSTTQERLVKTDTLNKYGLYRPSLFGQDGWILDKLIFFAVYGPRMEVHKHAKKKMNEANIQPS